MCMLYEQMQKYWKHVSECGECLWFVVVNCSTLQPHLIKIRVAGTHLQSFLNSVILKWSASSHSPKSSRTVRLWIDRTLTLRTSAPHTCREVATTEGNLIDFACIAFSPSGTSCRGVPYDPLQAFRATGSSWLTEVTQFSEKRNV